MSETEVKIQNLRALGLSDEQANQAVSIVQVIPECINLKKLKEVIRALNKANTLLKGLAESDPLLIADINHLLPESLALDNLPIVTINEALNAFTDNQDIHFTQTVEMIDPSKPQSSPTSNYATPTSKNYRRFKALTDQWNSWGKDIALSDSSEFIMFLTICLFGEYSLQQGGRTRKNYERYFIGLKVGSDSLNTDDYQQSHIEVKITRKAKEGQEPETEVLEATLMSPVRDTLQQGEKALKKKRN